MFQWKKWILVAVLFVLNGSTGLWADGGEPIWGVDAYGKPVPEFLRPIQEQTWKAFTEGGWYKKGFYIFTNAEGSGPWRITLEFDPKTGQNPSGAYNVQMIVGFDWKMASENALLYARSAKGAGYFWTLFEPALRSVPQWKYRAMACLLPTWGSWNSTLEHISWMGPRFPKDQFLLFSVFGKVSDGTLTSLGNRLLGQLEFLKKEKFPSAAKSGESYRSNIPGYWSGQYGRFMEMVTTGKLPPDILSEAAPDPTKPVPKCKVPNKPPVAGSRPTRAGGVVSVLGGAVNEAVLDGTLPAEVSYGVAGASLLVAPVPTALNYTIGTGAKMATGYVGGNEIQSEYAARMVPVAAAGPLAPAVGAYVILSDIGSFAYNGTVAISGGQNPLATYGENFLHLFGY